jgi:uncharacterized protein YbjT (DUF2867 family)
MIVITTPTPQIGSQVLANLLDTDEDLRVIARDPSSLRGHALDRLEVIEGSLSDATVVEEAFVGASAAFSLAPPDPRACWVEAALVGFTRPAAAATRLLLDPSAQIRYHPTLNRSAKHDRREAHTTARERGRTFR